MRILVTRMQPKVNMHGIASRRCQVPHPSRKVRDREGVYCLLEMEHLKHMVKRGGEGGTKEVKTTKRGAGADTAPLEPLQFSCLNQPTFR